MRQKLLILFSVLIILAAIFFMTKDYFFDNKNNQENPYEYDLTDLKETDSSQLCCKEILEIPLNIDKPKAISIDKNDRIYIAGSGYVLIYESNGTLLDKFEVKKVVSALKIAEDGKIYLAMQDHVEVWDTMGVYYDNWEKPNEKAVFTSIDVSENDVFVADAGNKIVYRYNKNGELLNEIGEKDSLKGIPGFVIPSPYFDLAIGRDGELWVVNSGRHSFEAYQFDGKLISSWKRSSMGLEGFSGCCNPSHMAILSDGSFVTSEKGLERVKIHSPSGDYKCLVAGSESFEDGTKGIDLAVDSKDRILVLDPYKKKIVVYEKH
jgi:hypothetical protein